MDTEKILPIIFPPPIKCYLPITIVSSIVTANIGDNSWIMNNFIQLYIPKGSEKLESFPFQDFMYFDQNLLHVDIINDFNHKLEKNIIYEILEWIDNGNYVIIYVDEHEVPGTYFYKKSHLIHSQFIYGYNMAQKKFKILNFNSKKILSELEVSFADMENAIFSESTKERFLSSNSWNDRDIGHKIILIRLTDNKNSFYFHRLNKEYILNEIKHYYDSENSSNYTSYFTGQLHGTWGMDIYQEIIKILKLQRNRLDYRMFHVLYEHKVYMRERLGLFDFGEKYSDRYFELVRKSDRLRAICLKYNTCPSEMLIDRMMELVMELYHSEKSILYNFLLEKGGLDN